MNTNTTELNLDEMETVNGTGLWDDFKATMGMIGKKADHWIHVFGNAVVEEDKRNRESGDPTPTGVTKSIIKGWIYGFLDICTGK